MRKTLFFLLKLALSATLMGVIIDQGLESLDESQQSFPTWSVIVTAFGFSMLTETLASQRTRFIVQAIRYPLSLRFSVWLQCVCLFFNIGLPGAMGGDAIRILELRKKNIPVQESITALLLDRALGFSVLLFFSALGGSAILATGDASNWFQWVLILGGLGLLGSLAVLFLLPKLLHSWQHWRLVRLLLDMSATAYRMLKHPFQASFAILLALVLQVSQACAVYWLLISQGQEIAFPIVLAATAMAVLIGTLPISLGGFGVREGVLVTILGLAGVPEGIAVMTALLFGSFILLLALPGGLLWLFGQRPLQH